MKTAVRAIVVRGDQMLVMHRNKFGHEYYTLLGGSIGIAESAEQALVRQVLEESSMRVTAARLTFVEDGGDIYGMQYIYVCQVEGESLQLAPDSEEAKINQLGQNIYTPTWVPAADFANLTFRTPLLQQAIMLGLLHGFPAQPVQLNEQFLEQVQTSVDSQRKV
jgi:ADP-ribose pyrophosphatase YjhB (NUDIX family)